MSRRCWTRCSLFIVFTCCVHQRWAVIPGLSVDYIFYTTPLSWNDARSVCQSIGGDLAKLDSHDVIDILYTISLEENDITAMTEPYWVGLVFLNEGIRQWVGDCSTLTLPSVYDSSFDPNKLCIMITDTAPNKFLGVALECNKENPFLCERPSDDDCLSFKEMTGVLRFTVLTGRTTSEQCKNSCMTDVNCLYVMLLSATKCYKFSTISDIYDDSADLKYKFCATFTTNTTTAIAGSDNSLTPSNPCLGADQSFRSALKNRNNQVIDILISVSPATSTVDPNLTPSTSYMYSSTSTPDIMATCSPIVLTEMVTAPCESTPVCQQNTMAVSLSQDPGQVAEELERNLTIDAKTTSSYKRSLTSAPDFRKTATAMGIVGIACIAFPVTILIFVDFRRFLDDIKGRRKEMPRDIIRQSKYINTGMSTVHDSPDTTYTEGCLGVSNEMWKETSKGKSGIKVA